MSIAVVLYTLLSCITAVVVPWLGVVFYYLLAVGDATAVWPQAFGDSRSSLYISLATIVGLGLATATTQVDYRRLFMLPNVLLMIVVVLFNVSLSNSPYEGFEEIKRAALSPLEMQEVFNKTLLFYFVAVLLIDTRFKLIFLISAIGGVLLFYTLWANKIYVTDEFWRFGDNGRLSGPLDGTYEDENFFAMLCLLATPIFYYLSVGTSSRIIRYGLWICIPFSWHALFLTGSRGALLALAIVCMYIFFRSYSKKASIIIVVALVVAIVDQSGNMISRISTTMLAEEETEQARAFIENTDDSPEITGKALDPRIIAWQVGLGIMRDYPWLGIGAGNYMRAYPDYNDSEPFVAHNTFVQFGTACGVGAGFIYLFYLFLRLKNVVKRSDPTKTYRHGYKRDYLDDLLNSLFLAFYIVAFFLDLMIIELLYFVILVGVCKYCLDNKHRHTYRSMIGSIYRWNKGEEKEAVVDPQIHGGVAVAIDHFPRAYGDDKVAPVEAEPQPVVPAEEPPRNQYAPR